MGMAIVYVCHPPDGLRYYRVQQRRAPPKLFLGDPVQPTYSVLSFFSLFTPSHVCHLPGSGTARSARVGERAPQPHSSHTISRCGRLGG